MRKEEYIQEVISRIENKRAKQEVERELSAHIDDRISYYTDAGYDEETSNNKALEHMGEAKEIAEKMEKLHNTKRRNCFIALLSVFCVYVVLHFIVPAVFTISGWDSVSLWYIPDIAIILSDIFVCAVFLISAFTAYKKEGSLFFVVLGTLTSFAVFTILNLMIFGFTTYLYMIPRILVIVALFILSVFACGWTDDEKKRWKKDSSDSKLKRFFGVLIYPVVSILIAGFILMSTAFIYTITESIYDAPREAAYNKRASEIMADYSPDNQPVEVASEEEVAGIDTENYNSEFDLRWKMDDRSFENWSLDYKNLKTTKKFPERFNSDFVTYWLTNVDGVICRAKVWEYNIDDDYDLSPGGLNAEDIITTDYLISNDFNYPDFEKATVDEMRVNDTDISSAFSDEELEIIRLVINNPEHVGTTALDYDMKFSKIEWTFEEAEGFINRTGYFIVDSAGSYYISSSINTIRDSNGNITTSTGLFRLDDDTAEKLKTLLSYEDFTTDYSD